MTPRYSSMRYTDYQALELASRDGFRSVTQAVVRWHDASGGNSEVRGDFWAGDRAEDYPEVIRQAKVLGWTKPRWWKPWRWGDMDYSAYEE